MSRPKERRPQILLGLSHEEHAGRPPMGLTWYRVRNGDTIGKIANRHGIPWTDLMILNFRTVDPDEINWYLRHYVGCKHYSKSFYRFSSDDKPGYLLVPAPLPKGAPPPPRTVRVLRGGKATTDEYLSVEVRERTRGGKMVELSGKWLYVFSAPGPSFGVTPPTPDIVDGVPRPGRLPLVPSDDPRQPGSAFTGWFPGANFWATNKPDRLDYEIFVTPKNGPSDEHLQYVLGKVPKNPTHGLRLSRSWYMLSDQAILDLAVTQPRAARTQHAFRNHKTVLLKLAPASSARCYYFFLSPVQLGPKAIQHLVDHPGAMTPLLDPKAQEEMWKADNERPSLDFYVGPTLDTFKGRTMTLGVVDPYAWAESIVDDSLSSSLSGLSQWMNSTQPKVLEALEKETTWTPEVHALASILDAVRQASPEKAKIDAELDNPAQFKSRCRLWKEAFVDQTAGYTARAKQDITEFTEWIRGIAHRTIEIAITQDTDLNRDADWIDAVRGLAHHASTLLPTVMIAEGQELILELFDQVDSVPHRFVWSKFRDLGQPTINVTLQGGEEQVLRYAPAAVLTLLAIRYLVDPKPPVPPGQTLEQFITTRATQLAEVYSAMELAPIKLTPKSLDLSTSGGGVVSLLDFSDKVTTYIVDPNVNIDRSKGRLMWALGGIEEWLNATPRRQQISHTLNSGSSYALKATAGALTIYNMSVLIHKTSSQFESTASAADWMSATSALTIATQDILSEMVAWSGRTAIQEMFPSLVTTASSKSAWAMTEIVTVTGYVYASINVVAMLVLGGATTYLMAKGFADSVAVGNSSAAGWYFVATGGGMAVAGGAGVFAYKLWILGAGATGSGLVVGGLVAFALGGIVAAAGAIGAAYCSDSRLSVFARKCYFGKESMREPRFERFGIGTPPDWTHAKPTAPNSWPVHLQRRALFNILGSFKFESELSQDCWNTRTHTFKGPVFLTLSMGLMLSTSIFAVTLIFGDGSLKQSWDIEVSSRRVKQTVSGPFTARLPVLHDLDSGKFLIRIDDVSANCSNEDLFAFVELRYKGEPNVIRAEKEIVDGGLLAGLSNGEIESEKYT